MPRTDARARRVIVLVLFLAVGAALDVVAGSAGVLILVVLAIVATTHAPRIGWALAFSGTLLAAFVAQTVFLLLTPLLPWSMAWSNLIAWLVVGLAHAVVLSRRRFTIDPVRRDRVLAISVLPGLIALALVAKMIVSHGSWIGWGMRGDVTQKTLAVRFILDDDGLARPNNDALTTVLDTAWSVGVQIPTLPGDMLHSLVVGSEQVWLITWLLVSLVGGIIASGNTASAPRSTRWAAVAIVEALPFTWYASGNSFSYGFQNSSVACLLLALSWVAWRALARRPGWVIPILLLAVVACGMAWVPLAVVPAALLVASLVRVHRGRMSLPLASRLAAVAVVMSGAVFVLVQSLPSLLVSVPSVSGIFSVDGSIMTYNAVEAIVLFLVGLVVVIPLRRRVQRGTLLGLVAVAVSAGIVLVLLLSTRAGESTLFGYYPVKFLWSLSIVFVAVWIAELLPAVSGLPALAGFAILVALVPALYAAAESISPNRFGPFDRGSIAMILRDDSRDLSASELFGILDTHPRSIVTRYSLTGGGAGYQDFFIDFWLLQISVDRIPDPIRSVAYAMDPDDPQQICRAVAIWGPGVHIYTSSRAQATAVEAACSPSRLGYTMVVRTDAYVAG